MRRSSLQRQAERRPGLLPVGAHPQFELLVALEIDVGRLNILIRQRLERDFGPLDRLEIALMFDALRQQARIGRIADIRQPRTTIVGAATTSRRYVLVTASPA